MKKCIVIIIFLFTLQHLSAQVLYFPPISGSAWDTATFASLGWDSTKIDTLYNFLQSKNTKAFLVLKNGKIVIEKYFDSFTVDSIWYWASAGKTITSFLIGIAQQEGYLSIEDTTSKYLGEIWTSCPPDKEALITIKHQLTMTTGLDDYVSDPYCTLPGCLTYLTDAGNRWAYHNAPYTLLDSVIENATGQNLNQYFYFKVSLFSGINGLFIKSGYNNVFFSTLRSMARFGLLILNKGKWNTTTILSDTNYYGQMITTSQNLNKSYGYLWWLNGKDSYMLPQTQFIFPGYLNPDAPSDMIVAAGKNGQFLNIVPSQNLIFVRMGNAPDSNLVPIVLNNQIWQLLNPIINPTSDIENTSTTFPNDFNLEQNFPNPFNPTTKIRYSIPMATFLQLKIYDILGQEIATLVNEEQTNGTYEVEFDGSKLSSGIYFYELIAEDFQEMKKMIILK